MTESAGNVPPRIFISYRRQETGWAAGWLFDRLADHFGRDQIFKDVDSIELGDDFIEVITAAVGSCDVLLALIGDRWLAITDQDGRRRLDNPADFVRLEIESALARGVRIIPILVSGARMPRADQLPVSLAMLARRQALEFSPSRFGSDFQRLLPVLDRAVATAQDQARQQVEVTLPRHRQIEQLSERLRERASAQDWDAVVGLSSGLAALDPAAADPDALASAAREQITRRQQAEKDAAQRHRQIEGMQQERREQGDHVSAERQPIGETKHKSMTEGAVRARTMNEEGEVAKRYHLAIRQLRYGNLEARISAIQDLDQVGLDSAKFRPRVIRGLTEFIAEYPGPILTPDLSMARRVRKRHADRNKPISLSRRDFVDADLRQRDLAGKNLADTDLTNADLTDANLIGANLTDARLCHADLTGADLTDADLTEAKLADAKLAGARLIGANLAGADLTNANLTRARLPGADLTDADLTNAKLISADLADNNLADTDLFGVNLPSRDFAGADFTGTNLIGADLANARCAGVRLAGANLAGANLTSADMTRADLARANLTDANLSRVDLASADLLQADLIRVDLTYANLKGAIFNWANLDGADLCGVVIGDWGTAFATDFRFASLANTDLTCVNLRSVDLTCVNLTLSRWPEAFSAPKGWVRDSGSGMLRKAAKDAGS